MSRLPCADEIGSTYHLSSKEEMKGYILCNNKRL